MWQSMKVMRSLFLNWIAADWIVDIFKMISNHSVSFHYFAIYKSSAIGIVIVFMHFSYFRRKNIREISRIICLFSSCGDIFCKGRDVFDSKNSEIVQQIIFIRQSSRCKVRESKRVRAFTIGIITLISFEIIIWFFPLFQTAHATKSKRNP